MYLSRYLLTTLPWLSWLRRVREAVVVVAPFSFSLSNFLASGDPLLAAFSLLFFLANLGEVAGISATG